MLALIFSNRLGEMCQWVGVADMLNGMWRIVRREPGGSGLLQKTVSFSAPSGAADFVLGGSNNGWIEWKDGDKQTLDALYRK